MQKKFLIGKVGGLWGEKWIIYLYGLETWHISWTSGKICDSPFENSNLPYVSCSDEWTTLVIPSLWNETWKYFSTDSWNKQRYPEWDALFALWDRNYVRTCNSRERYTWNSYDKIQIMQHGWQERRVSCSSIVLASPRTIQGIEASSIKLGAGKKATILPSLSLSSPGALSF